MRISNHSYTAHQILFRYCSTFLSSISRKTLNPKSSHNVVPSIQHRAISSLCNSLSGLSSFPPSESYPFRLKTFISNSNSGPCSFFCFRLYSIQKKQSFSSSLHGPVSKCCSNPYLPIKNQFSNNSPSWLFSRCKTESYAPYKHQSLCYFSSSNGTIISSPVVETEVHNFPTNFVFEIADILLENGEDLEFRLNAMSSRLSVQSITEIFEVLNNWGISGSRFFEWVRSNNPNFRRNANICSLIINHFGRLDDYETMFSWLKMFTAENICLTHDAFKFLPMSGSTSSSLNASIQRVVGLLNRVGGSCRNSGIYALIEMFCKFNSYEMAKYVITITESKKISYFCILVREKCKYGLIEDAHSIIREMQENHCEPNTTVYNYILGSLWKNRKTDEAFALLGEMKELNIPPDEITFEILINFVCSLGKMDDAHKLLDQMSSHGLEPRLTTHAKIVKTLFAVEKYEAAREFVVDLSYKTSSNMMYSLMANLYREKGDVMSARDVLVEMMDKGLKPNFGVYLKIVKRLRRIRKGNLARDLEIRHSKFAIKSRA